jgi:hypothetical protein
LAPKPIRHKTFQISQNYHLSLRERAMMLGFSERKAVAEWVRVFDVFL